MIVTGKIEKIKEIEKRGDFQFRDIVLEFKPGFEKAKMQYVTLQFRGDKISLLDDYKVNDKVDVSFNLTGRKWEKPNSNEVVYFNTIVGWKIENHKKEITMADQAPDKTDDLPF